MIQENKLEYDIAKELTDRGLTLSVAESCTGGWLSKRITDVPGASNFYKGGACTYWSEIKQLILGVRRETLDAYTAVSVHTAREMALGIARAYGTDFGIGITGYAGPDGGEDGTPAGTIHIGLSDRGRSWVLSIYSPDGRQSARVDACNQALRLLLTKVREKAL